MGEIARTLQGLTKARLSFPGWGGGASWGGHYTPFRGQPGERDWSKVIGDGSSNSIVVACILWMCRNFTQAPATVVETDDNGIAQIIRGHALPKLLRRPNPYYSGTLLMYGVLTDFLVSGDGYIIKARDDLDRVRELWYAPHRTLNPRWGTGGNTFIDYYDYNPNGEVTKLAPRDVYHLRYGLDPNNTRKGLSPLASLFRELGVDEEASRFSASILHNLGVPGVILSPDKDFKGNLEKDARDAIKSQYKQEFGGDNRGGVMVASRSMNIEQFGFSPNELDLSSIRDVPEERVTAVLGIPAPVVGFQMQNSKVGATMAELRDQAGENALVPTQHLVEDELTLQMLPDFATPKELETQEVQFDLSKVRLFAEANGKLAERQSTLARAGIAMRSESRAAVGLPVRPGDEVFIPSPGVQVIQPDGTTAETTPAQQAALDAVAAAAAAKARDAQVFAEREAERKAWREESERKDEDRRKEAAADRLVLLEGLREIQSVAAKQTAELVAAVKSTTGLGTLSPGTTLTVQPQLKQVQKTVTKRDERGHILEVLEREVAMDN